MGPPATTKPKNYPESPPPSSSTFTQGASPMLCAWRSSLLNPNNLLPINLIRLAPNTTTARGEEKRVAQTQKNTLSITFCWVAKKWRKRQNKTNKKKKQEHSCLDEREKKKNLILCNHIFLLGSILCKRATYKISCMEQYCQLTACPHGYLNASVIAVKPNNTYTFIRQQMQLYA